MVWWQSHTCSVWDSTVVLTVTRLWVSTSTHQTGHLPSPYPHQTWASSEWTSGSWSRDTRKDPFCLFEVERTLESDQGVTRASPREWKSRVYSRCISKAALKTSWGADRRQPHRKADITGLFSCSQIFIEHLLSIQHSDQGFRGKQDQWLHHTCTK